MIILILILFLISKKLINSRNVKKEKKNDIFYVDLVTGTPWGIDQT